MMRCHVSGQFVTTQLIRVGLASTLPRLHFQSKGREVAHVSSAQRGVESILLVCIMTIILLEKLFNLRHLVSFGFMCMCSSHCSSADGAYYLTLSVLSCFPEQLTI
ncbi:TPA: hypothetical protein ACH3X2_009370 [Trebouxia sp. C0005]